MIKGSEGDERRGLGKVWCEDEWKDKMKVRLDCNEGS